MFELRKIGIVKRASAWLLDAILLMVLTTGFMFLIGLICHYQEEADLFEQYFTEWDDYRVGYIRDLASHYGYACEEFGGEYVVTKDGEPASIDDVIAKLLASKGEEEETAEAYQKYLALPPLEKQYRYVNSMLFMMISLGLLLSYFILEFIVPLFLKNGQTVGKKVFGICLVRPDCVRITSISLFARTVLGKFAIESMFPVLLVFLFFFAQLGLISVILLAAFLILEVVLFFATKNRTPIHDILAYTVAVDMQLQMIFDSEEELNEKKALAAKEKAEKEKNA